MRYTDEDLLKIVGEERKRSIGFGEGDSGELQASRVKAHEYSRGLMSDVKALPNRSSVSDTAIADAVETLTPDIIEVFFGGEDVVTFVPESGEDEDIAQEESDAVKYNVFTLNQALIWFTAFIKDALLERLGIFHWWWEDDEREDRREDLQPDEAAVMLSEIQQAKPWAKVELEEGGDGTISLVVSELRGRICFRAVNPDDFSVASDTVILGDTTYCVMRDRPRVQDLIARGIDAAKARELPTYTTSGDEVEHVKDAAGEHESSDAAHKQSDLRVVETRAHYLRYDAGGDGKLKIVRIITDVEEKVLLEKEEVSHIPFGAATPYLIAHRLYGLSLADKLFELQKIKTVLWRAHLDSIYFSLNQRMTVDMTKANEWTIADLLANEPGRPIRVNGEGGVIPVSAGALNVDTLASLEYAATQGEMRSGVVRNAQGLNPDTLHDTKGGMERLVQAAHKRVRFIARMMSETGVKDLFLGVRRLMRENYSSKYAPAQMQLGPKKWKTLKPSQWADRREVTCHVGVGSSGREQELAVAAQGLEITERVIQLQGGASGPLVTMSNLHNRLKKWSQAAGERDADRYWSDPEDPNTPKPEPQPDPAMAKAQGELQIKQAEGQANLQMKAQEGQMNAQLAEQQSMRDHELKVAEMQMNMALKREQIAAELELKREQLSAEIELKRQLGFVQAQVQRETGMAKAEASTATSGVEPGGEPG